MCISNKTDMETDYLHSIRKEFEYYKFLGEKTFDQLEEQDLLWQFNENSNSIAIIVNHLCGNMLSRWTNFLTSDGEKEWRVRDLEFEDDLSTRAEIEQRWNAGWECLFRTLNSLTEADLQREIYIRN